MTTRFRCGDGESLVAFVYNELDAESGAEVSAHLAACAACQADVEALGGVRRALGLWAPPMPPLRFSVVSDAPAASAPPPARHRVPAWAQLAAASLAVGVSVSIANVQVRRDTTGWTLTTGWIAQSAPAARPVGTPDTTEWQPALAKLEQSLRSEMAARQASAAAAAVPAAPVDPTTITRVRTLIQDSERRQQQELALRLTQFSRDLDLQRRADLVRIDQGIGQLEGRTGAEVARQREMLNYIVRTSLRPPQ
jgi:hypothetical protein